MKIIFDSKKQKEVLLDALSDSTICPYHLGIGYDYDCIHECGGCVKCWKNAVEMEIRDKIENRENNMKCKIINILEDMELYTIGRMKNQPVCLTVKELQIYIDHIRKALEEETNNV